MAHQTGTYANGAGLLAILRVFALANGWTENASTATELYLQRGSLYFNFTTESDRISVSGSTGYNGGDTWDNQPGSLGTGKYGYAITTEAGGTYHLFANAGGDSTILFVEEAGTWSQAMFGKTTLDYPTYICSYGKGGGVIEDDWGSFLWTDRVNNPVITRASIYFNGMWTNRNATTGSLVVPCGRFQTTNTGIEARDTATLPLSASTTQFKGNSILVPSYLFHAAGANEVSGDTTYVGYIEGLRLMSRGNYLEGDTVYFGPDEYIVTSIAPEGIPSFSSFPHSVGVVAKK